MNKPRFASMALEGISGHDAGRQLLFRLYQKETGLSCPEIGFSPSGKPYFLNSDLEFSISHSQRHAFCVLFDRPIGIDAEEADRQFSPRLPAQWLSESEYLRWEKSPDQNAAFLRLWVLKEALAKQTGRGIGNWLKNTDFDPNDPRISLIDGCYVAIITD